ncbi:flagellar hook-associated protein FlgL [Saccharococcus caldoxylosilyticus]|uniref:Flagellar hook-associated protein FlgL n=1 Tax=Parageobacillus caldoxylosilyticus NBRC 107762 TaxID=1220594 RepID=A0A023DD81_9BACL|nr:flagellar hook-associated protein FlgL [Parageobacillus caldoxylosilyticus]MBB3852544.1 flagellar hook-associated protein 3 FlgL [Parageobacillus caldoxylosilyticus]GAJ39268.1 flagellar hook-associated protein FlgL [Parageobacillus caldoxylosilyticus NBRC 107762]
MRVTQSMLANNMLKHLSASYANLGKYQEQLSTGKKINRPSDDPVVAMKGIAYRTNLTEVEQFKRNFSEAYNWIENSDAALDKATQALQRIRELVVQASNDTYEATQRQAISQEIKQLTDQLVMIANTKVGDKYIFNGTNTLEPPVQMNGTSITTSDNAEEVKIELAKGIYIGVNVDPTKVFHYDASQKGKGLFSDLQSLANDLDDPAKTGKEINEYLGYIDQHITNLLGVRAELGARMNRIELMEDRIDSQQVIAEKMLSDNEDVDMEKVITDLKTQESVHRAALAVGARIIQPTLVDFLR